MKQTISFTVYGKVEPMARARVFTDRHTGKIRAINPAKCEDWKNVIRQQALAHKPDTLLDSALELTLVFYLLRPPSKPKRELAPRWKPDCKNLLAAVEDALEGVFYTNDSRIVKEHVEKCYGDPTRVAITVAEV